MVWCSVGGTSYLQASKTKYVLMSSEVFRISGVAVSQRCCYCNLEMALRQMSLSMDQWQPQHSRSSHGLSQGTRVGRHFCQSVASGVCLPRPRLLQCSFLEYTRSSSRQTNCKGDARPERNNHKEFLGSVGWWLHKVRPASALVEDMAVINMHIFPLLIGNIEYDDWWQTITDSV